MSGFAFECICGHKTLSSVLADEHHRMCPEIRKHGVSDNAPVKAKAEPIDILVSALEEMNEIITSALTHYRRAKKEEEK